jgi:hypothetical protein
MNSLQQFLFNMKTIYLAPFDGQYMLIEGTSYAEQISNSTVILDQTSPDTYNVQLFFKTEFNQRIFAQTVNSTNVNDFEAAIKTLTDLATAQLNNPRKQADVPGG